MKKVFIAFLLILWGFCANAKALTATYDAKALGMRLLSGTLTITENEADYRMETKTQARGVLGWFLSSNQTFISTGVKEDLTCKPTYFMHKTDDRMRELDAIKLSPYLDYQTAVLEIMQMMEPCPSVTKKRVFDGKRVMELTFTYQGKQELTAQQTYFPGLADHYLLSVEVIKGKKKGWFFERTKNKDNPPLRLWFRQVKPDTPSLLVRAEFDTAIFGTAVVLLKEAK